MQNSGASVVCEMELGKCQIILQDDRVLFDRHVTRDSGLYGESGMVQAVGSGLAPPEADDLTAHVQSLLKVFENGTTP